MVICITPFPSTVYVVYQWPLNSFCSFWHPKMFAWMRMFYAASQHLLHESGRICFNTASQLRPNKVDFIKYMIVTNIKICHLLKNVKNTLKDCSNTFNIIRNLMENKYMIFWACFVFSRRDKFCSALSTLVGAVHTRRHQFFETFDPPLPFVIIFTKWSY